MEIEAFRGVESADGFESAEGFERIRVGAFGGAGRGARGNRSLTPMSLILAA